MLRISKIHADRRAAKTYLATLGSPDLNLLPHEVFGCAFFMDHRRHRHDAFLRLLNVVDVYLRGSHMSRANSSARAKLFSIDMLPVSAIGFDDGRGGKSGGGGRSRG